MSDFKLLFGFLAAMALLVAGWWFGWFGPITQQFLEFKRNVVH